MTAEIATLGLAVDSRAVTVASKALDDLQASAKPAAKAADDLTKSVKPLTAAADDLAKVVASAGKGISSIGGITAAANTNVKALTAQTGLARHEMINFGRQMQDVGTMLAMGASPMQVITSQAAQIVDIFASSKGTVGGFFSQMMSGVASVVTPVRALAGGVIGIGTAAALMGSNWTGAQKQVELGLMGIGRASGATVGDINAIADATSSWRGLSVSEAREVATAFASTGKIGTESIERLTAQTRNFAALTGTDVPKAAEALANIFAKPSEGAKTLAARIGGIDAATIRYIQTLDEQGDRQGAIKALIDAMSPALSGAADKAGVLAKSWNAVGNAFSNSGTAIGKALAGTADQQSQDQLEKRRAELEKLIATTKQLAETDTGSQKIFDTNAIKTYTAELGNVTAALERIKLARDASTSIDASAFTSQITPLINSLAPGPEVLRNMTSSAAALQKVMDDPAFEAFRKTMGDQLPLALARARAGLDALTQNQGLADPIKSAIQSLSTQNQLLSDQSPAMRARVAYQLAYNDAIRQGSDAEARQIASMRAAAAYGGPMTDIQTQQTAIVAPHGRTLSAKEAKAAKSQQTTHQQDNTSNDCIQRRVAA